MNVIPIRADKMIGYLVVETGRVDRPNVERDVAICLTPEKARKYIASCGHIHADYRVEEVDFIVPPGCRIVENGDGSLVAIPTTEAQEEASAGGVEH